MDIKKKLAITNQSYNAYVKKNMPKSHTFVCCLRAFLFGGLICTVGQVVNTLATELLHLSVKDASSFTAVVMVFFGAFFTGLGVYDVLGKYAGAGSIVPITGFANSIVSPAMEFKREGYILGVGAKLFTIAGPVLVYGISSSVAVGAIYWLLRTMGWCI